MQRCNKYEAGTTYLHAIDTTYNTYSKVLQGTWKWKFVDVDMCLTYKELLTQSIRTALKLKELGVFKKDVITICSKHQYNIIALCGAFFNDTIITSTDPNSSSADTAHMLKIAAPKVIFTSVEALSMIETAVKEIDLSTKIVVFGQSEKHMEFSEFLKPNCEERHFHPDTSVNNKDTALIFFSSGTTGLPKGMCVSHDAILLRTVQSIFMFNHGLELSNIKIMSDKPNIILQISTSFYWISTVIVTFMGIFSGGTSVLTDKFNGKVWWDLIQKEKVNYFYLAPTVAIEIIKCAPNDSISRFSPDFFLLGGGGLPIITRKQLQEKFPKTILVNSYGMTESVGLIAAFKPKIAEDVALQEKHPDSCGLAVPGVNFKIVDLKTNELLGPNEQGEIRVKTDYRMNGLYNMESSDIFDEDGWIKTGDLGYYDEDECIYIVDRLKEIFKYKRHQIVPNKIENIIVQHPDVMEAVVLGIPHTTDGHHPRAVVVLKETAQVTTDELIKFVHDQVPEWQQLRGGLEFSDKLEKTVTGKYKRREQLRLILEKQKANCD